nr:immunoglobulin heavy chain junction region [Mus musculus]
CARDDYDWFAYW